MLDTQDIEQSQDDRLLRIKTSLGENKVLLTALSGFDEVSRPFSFQLQMWTRVPPAQVRTLLGKPLTAIIANSAMPQPRPVHGVVQSLTRVAGDIRDGDTWRAEIVPTFALLRHTGDCRIFQNLSVPEILRKVLGEHSVDFEVRSLLGTYPKLDYCVQYRESTFAFLSRLMEYVGLFYWHEHKDDKHLLVIADSNTAVQPAFVSPARMHNRGDLGEILSLEESYAFRPGKWTVTDYDFVSPSKSLKASKPTTLTVSGIEHYEVYDYPGGYTDSGAGNDLARRRIEGEEAQHHRLSGTASTAGLDAGRKLVVTFPATTGEDLTLMLASVQHDATDMSHRTGADKSSSYAAAFTALPHDVPFRPELRTPRPTVHGPQTATVTGPAGDEIHTDEHGRVKVRFHWDRNPEGNKDENSSCWLRVSQVWAGKQWGSIHIPRIGQEVIVEFLEGDPDRPIITGRVYNGAAKPPYGLPANATQSGLKSNSTKGGGGSNELRFEDKKGSEQVYLHAQKDLETLVENNEKHTVVKNRSVHVKVNEDKKVDANKETTVKGDFKETINGTETRTVTGNVDETFLANEKQFINGDRTLTVAGNMGETVLGKRTDLVTGLTSQTYAGGLTQTTPLANVTVAGAYNITCGTWNLVAPPSTTTGAVANALIGANNAVYGTNNAIVGANNAIYASNVQAAGINAQQNGLSSTIIGVQLDKIGVETEDTVIAIKKGATAIKTFALNLFS